MVPGMGEGRGELAMDTARRLTKWPQSHFDELVQQRGLKYVGRYLSTPQGKATRDKDIIQEEAVAIAKAGLRIYSIWESNPTTAQYFKQPEIGFQDAYAACAEALSVGQRNGAIYFTVDFDAGPGDAQNVSAYFDGVCVGVAKWRKDQLRTSPQSIPDYKIGVYGSCYVLDLVEKHGVCDYLWQALSPGWSGGRNANQRLGANLWQISSAVFFGASFDLNQVYGDVGSWVP